MRGQPLPGSQRPDSGLFGPWRGFITAAGGVDGPFSVSIPRLTGQDGAVTDCESAVFDPPLVVGDRVWVWPIEGNRDAWMIGSRRV